MRPPVWFLCHQDHQDHPSRKYSTQPDLHPQPSLFQWLPSCSKYNPSLPSTIETLYWLWKQVRVRVNAECRMFSLNIFPISLQSIDMLKSGALCVQKPIYLCAYYFNGCYPPHLNRVNQTWLTAAGDATIRKKWIRVLGFWLQSVDLSSSNLLQTE